MKQTLKIGEQYRLKQDVLWYKAGTIFERDSEGQTYITELDGIRYRTLDALQLAICDHRNEEGSEQYFELIKSKTKKVKKWENSRKELADWINELDINYKKIIIEKLLATQPQPIKEESKEIELPEKLITVDYCGELVQFTFEDEFKNWIKQVTDTLNSLTKRNIK